MDSWGMIEGTPGRQRNTYEAAIELSLVLGAVMAGLVVRHGCDWP
jgi:hypothetical protein